MILVAGDARFEHTDKGTVLVYEGERIMVSEGKEAGITGAASAVHAVDWDGDGKLDLLVGDYSTQKPDRPEPTPAEKAEQDKLRKELEAARRDFSKLIGRMRGPSRVKEKAEREKVEKEVREVSERMRGLREKLPPEYESHGWVWLYRRKPAEVPGQR